ncbi:MAG: ATP-binding protein [Bacteroidota bacterium]|nr:ATP-binding protein [Bacteroidota bacterium]
MRYSYTIAALLALLLLVVVFLIIIFRNSLHRKRVNKELLEKNREAIRQKELQEATLKELSESQKKTRAILKALPDVMFIFDQDGNYLDYHAKNDEDIIKSEEHLLGSNIRKELSEDFANKILEGIRKAAEDDQVQVFIHRDWVNKRRMDMELRIAPIEDGTFLMIGRNITERKKMERELKEARDEMQKALEAKSMYLASLSHEIRTPLTSIIGVTSILEDTDLSEEQQECTNIINISGNNLLNLINNILDFSRIESGQLKLEKVGLMIHEVIEEVVSLLDVKAKDSNNKITFEIDEKLHKNIFGDPYRLTQILINLVNNAIKFTKNGNIHIQVNFLEEKAGSLKLRFEVSDTGIGVSVEQRDKLFKAFSQADESIARKYGGSGLGLLISKHFVELMGGEIGLESEEGKGSIFWFTAGFEKESKPREAASKAQENKETIPQNEQAGSKNVLLVEDNLLNQKFAQAILKKNKHNVDIAENGKIGLEFFEKNQYDVILMDIQMPVMDGIQATKKIRMIETEKDMEPIRIVAVTAYAMEGDEEKFYQAGIDDYLRKPYKANQLLEKLEPSSEKDEDL